MTTTRKAAARPGSRLMIGVLLLAALLAGVAGPAAASGGGGGGRAGGGGGTFRYPTYAPPGVYASQSATSAAVDYVDDLTTVTAKLDSLYVARGCSIGPGKVNVYRYWLCPNAATHKIDEIDTTAASRDLSATNPYRSRVNFTLRAG